MGVPLNIDWQQILLHLFNFCILGGGLWLLLYKPVKSFMAKREDYYKDMDNAAKDKLKQAEEHEKLYAERLSAADKDAAEIRRKAMADAEQTAKAYLDDAEKQKQQIIDSARKTAQAEKQKVMQEANSEIEGMVSSAIDKILDRKGDAYNDFLNSVGKE